MSRFYADIQGERGAASRAGHKRIRGHIRGWDKGVQVVGLVDENGNDVFHIYETSGSNGYSASKLIAVVGSDPDGN